MLAIANLPNTPNHYQLASVLEDYAKPNKSLNFKRYPQRQDSITKIHIPKLQDAGFYISKEVLFIIQEPTVRLMQEGRCAKVPCLHNKILCIILELHSLDFVILIVALMID
jgi:hypothetical protein